MNVRLDPIDGCSEKQSVDWSVNVCKGAGFERD